MKILIWAAEHSVWISCVALFIVIPLKFEHWLPKQVKKYLLAIDIFIAVSTPLLGVLKENLDEHWKSQLKKQSGIHGGEIATLKRENKELQDKMEHTEKVLAPPSISLESKKIERHSTGICAKLRFKSSKTDSLPTLSFKVKIIEGDSKIIGFDLDIDSPIHQNRNADNFPKISEDGKTATVNFYTLNSTKADIRIDVSAPAKAIITGKYIDSPVTITIP